VTYKLDLPDSDPPSTRHYDLMAETEMLPRAVGDSRVKEAPACPLLDVPLEGIP
jgi:hypothetical protein